MAAISAWISASVFSLGASSGVSFSWSLGFVVVVEGLEDLDLEDLDLGLANIWTCVGGEERLG
jgi:hypothetical protein